MKEKIFEEVKKKNVKFIQLQFTDIIGVMKNINISASQLEKALNNEIMFDGSSIEGFARIEESDMYLYPDLATFMVLPDKISGEIAEARIICDIYDANRNPFPGDPRYILKKVIAEASELGYQMNVGPEMEFFLFKLDSDGKPTLTTNDSAQYFDFRIRDEGYLAKREICLVLEEMGFTVEANHHECAPGQHEIDIKYEEALKTADNIMTLKAITKEIAETYGLYATFMPKPIYGIAGSGMHLNQSLSENGKNIFIDQTDELGLSPIAYHYMAGLLKHAKGMSIITNPNINSYKRLVAGYEAPINIGWATKNRSPLIRVPNARGNSTRIELRNPDPSCNPYLAIAVALAAGLDGIKQQKCPPKKVEGNIFEFDKEALKEIDVLPENLTMALDYMLQDQLIVSTLGEHVVRCITSATNSDWDEYRKLITAFEISKYISL